MRLTTRINISKKMFLYGIEQEAGGLLLINKILISPPGGAILGVENANFIF